MGGEECLLGIWEVYAEVDAVKWGRDDRRYQRVDPDVRWVRR